MYLLDTFITLGDKLYYYIIIIIIIILFKINSL